LNFARNENVNMNSNSLQPDIGIIPMHYGCVVEAGVGH
jgi:hypothetical protein